MKKHSYLVMGTTQRLQAVVLAGSAQDALAIYLDGMQDLRHDTWSVHRLSKKHYFHAHIRGAGWITERLPENGANSHAEILRDVTTKNR